eukprot:5605872-Amphidinium_carterae.1
MLFVIAIFSIAILSIISGPVQILNCATGIGKSAKVSEHTLRACKCLAPLVVHLKTCRACTRNSISLAIPEMMLTTLSASKPSVGLLALPIDKAIRSELNDALTAMLTPSNRVDDVTKAGAVARQLQEDNPVRVIHACGKILGVFEEMEDKGFFVGKFEIQSDTPQAFVLSHFATRIALILNMSTQLTTSEMACRMVITLLEALSTYTGKDLSATKSSLKVPNIYGSTHGDIHSFYGKPDVGSASSLTQMLANNRISRAWEQFQAHRQLLPLLLRVEMRRPRLDSTGSEMLPIHTNFDCGLPRRQMRQG